MAGKYEAKEEKPCRSPSPSSSSDGSQGDTTIIGDDCISDATARDGHAFTETITNLVGMNFDTSNEDLREKTRECFQITTSNITGRVAATTLAEYRTIFECLDDDGSGAISIDEMEIAFRQMGITASSSQVRRLLTDIDEDGNGELDVLEFSVMLQRLTMGEKLVRC